MKTKEEKKLNLGEKLNLMEGVSSSREQEFTVTLFQEQICQIQDNYFGTSSQTMMANAD